MLFSIDGFKLIVPVVPLVAITFMLLAPIACCWGIGYQSKITANDTDSIISVRNEIIKFDGKKVIGV
jgi:hypothetical protein